MPERSRPPLPLVLASVGFTAFVWIGRIRNLLGDDEMSSGTKLGVAAMSASFLILAALVLWAWFAESDRLTTLVVVTTLWTTAVWSVRVVDIAFLGDHELPFVVVHTLLGVVSVALWFLMWRQVSRPRG